MLRPINMVRFCVVFLTLISAIFILPISTARAQTPLASIPHITLIINQVRGNECCGNGGVNELKSQLDAIYHYQLPTAFALRFDVLTNPSYTTLFKPSPLIEVAALLEITPNLASESGVAYTTTPDHWYEAAHAFLIGYTPQDRKKLIDTYMAKFKEVFGSYPKTTVGWMIDPVSLQYLGQTYGIHVHELTREQWGTDSYTLYGGPPHYPYYPSPQWALIPTASSSAQLPLIVRQTITDPVHTYGDPTSSYTSQPNDYMKRMVGFDYFQYLFNQAHNQPTQGYTFALLGLENSMATQYQQEFVKQIAFVAAWTKVSAQNQVMFPSQFATWLSTQPQTQLPVLYEGTSQTSSSSRAWWISTSSYRVRVRLDKGELYISDIRIYNPNLSDPYLQTPATKQGYWVVPFIIDGSRFFENDIWGDFTKSVPDGLLSRKSQDTVPTRLTLQTNILNQDASKYEIVKDNDTLKLLNPQHESILVFSANSFQFPTNATQNVTNSLTSFIQFSTNSWQWLDTLKQSAWGMTLHSNGVFTQAFPWIAPQELVLERNERYPLLLPEFSNKTIDASHTYVVASNQYAIAGRNPVRLVFIPKDRYGYPIALLQPPMVSASPDVTDISLSAQQNGNGMTFIDINQGTPGKFVVSLNFGIFSRKLTIYFAPNCKQEIGECLTHPFQLWWYIRNFIQDINHKTQDQQSSQMFEGQ